ncbi:MAG TPA: PIG-L family deacetylase [Candidatus Angelobacter sp.]
MLRLLCITAHPDDEAGGFGGTLLHYAQRGMETHVLCLTPGQAATHRGGAKSDDELAQMRRREFAASCTMLRVTSGTVLDYPDAGLDKQNFHSAVADLTRRVREIRPQVIMTMGPDGSVTAHADHSMVSIFGTMAYHWAARTNRFQEQLQAGVTPHRTQKLYYGTALFALRGRQPISPSPFSAIIELGKEGLETKIAAFKCHVSQAPLFPIFEETMRGRGSQELFHLAASSTPGKVMMETDLFAGIKE